jgi:hypothetical protein
MEKAAAAGDFVMLENEVVPVMKALVESGIELVAVHNHMVHEKPRIFFTPFECCSSFRAGAGPEVRIGTDRKNDETPKMKPPLAAYSCRRAVGSDVQ